MQQLNSKEIEQLAESIIKLTPTSSIDFKYTIRQAAKLITTACQQAQGDRWVSVSNPPELKYHDGDDMTSGVVIGWNDKYNVFQEVYYVSPANVFKTLIHKEVVSVSHWFTPTAPAEKKRLLSEITDEELNQIIVIANECEGKSIDEDAHILSATKRYVSHHGNDWFRMWYSTWAFRLNTTIKLIDYLRSKNYEI